MAEKEKMNLDQIRRHWEQAARELSEKGGISPTSRDPYLGQLEEQHIFQWLEKGQVVLEIGPGDGAHTMEYSQRVRSLSGIDVSNGLIRAAEKRLAAAGIENVQLRVGSALEIKDIYRPKQFDCVISQRCLINLPEWSLQQDAIVQVHGLLKAGGLFLLTEGFREGLDKLNALRQALELSAIQVVSYNEFMVRRNFEEFVGEYFDIIEARDYGLYTFLSHVFHPLAIFPDEPKHDSRLNQAASKIAQSISIPGMTDYSMNRFYVLGKR